MQNFLAQLKKQAQSNPKKIIFPEGTEERTLRAINVIFREKIAQPILLGEEKKILSRIQELGLSIEITKDMIRNPKTDSKKEEYQKHLYKLRKEKGMTEEESKKLIENELYFGLIMLEKGECDGMIGGTQLPTSETMRPTLQIIKTKEKFHKVSGVFLMLLENQLIFFADCAINVEPNSHDLADIAIDTAETAKRFGIEPRVAFLSFSTLGSSKHPATEKIREAVSIAKNRCPEILFEGELQVDAAIVPEVAAKKAPQSILKGTANILIFPSLESANIAYKLVERLAKAQAIGPFIQGLQKPVNDLSRGCNTEDIINATAFTVCEAQKKSNSALS
ncbi:MAG: phosphate acetyltransferase [Patescibacteria group bacterium]